MTKHTPGPWRLVAIEDRSIKHLCPCNADGVSILTIVHQAQIPFATVYEEADARLIAAAPEMFEALKLADAMLSGANMNTNVVEQKVRAAIAKVTGEAA